MGTHDVNPGSLHVSLDVKSGPAAKTHSKIVLSVSAPNYTSPDYVIRHNLVQVDKLIADLVAAKNALEKCIEMMGGKSL
jgi:hypothetical protein